MSATTVTIWGKKAIEVEPNDGIAYCGTTTGDAIAVNVQHAVLKVQ